MESQAIVLVAGHDVDVRVEHFLSGSLAVGLKEVQPVGVERRFDSVGDVTDAPEGVGHEVRGHLGQRLVVCFRDDERVAGSDRRNIEKRERRIVLVESVRGRFTVDDVFSTIEKAGWKPEGDGGFIIFSQSTKLSTIRERFFTALHLPASRADLK